MVLKLERFSHLSDRSIGFGSLIRLGYLLLIQINLEIYIDINMFRVIMVLNYLKYILKNSKQITNDG